MIYEAFIEGKLEADPARIVHEYFAPKYEKPNGRRSEAGRLIVPKVFGFVSDHRSLIAASRPNEPWNEIWFGSRVGQKNCLSMCGSDSNRPCNMTSTLPRTLCMLAVTVTTIPFAGCTYKLCVPLPPSEEQIKVIAKNPARYVLHVERYIPSVNERGGNDAPKTHISRAVNYEIPSSGLFTVRIPSYRPDCGVYLFKWIKVGGGRDDDLKDWEVSVLEDMKPVRTLTLKQLTKLPTDSAGNRLLKIRE
jgi:hypothetical protein